MAFDFDKLTVKAQEAVQNARHSAQEYGHPQLLPLHLLSSLLEEEQGVLRPLIEKIGANSGQLMSMIDSELGRQPRNSGTGFQVAVSSALMQVFEEAQKWAGQMMDSFVSTEHLLLALTKVNDEAKRLLELNAIEEADVLSALKAIRGGQQVNDQNPEDKYQALQRYGKDLPPRFMKI